MRLRKVFANGASANTKFSKTRLSKKVQLAVFMHDGLDFAVDPYKTLFDNLNKAEDLGKKV